MNPGRCGIGKAAAEKNLLYICCSSAGNPIADEQQLCLLNRGR